MNVQASSLQNKTQRIASIDAAKIIVIFCVIFIHLHPYYYLTLHKQHPHIYQVIRFLIEKICTVGVSLFFLASGYFFGQSLLKENFSERVAARYLKKILFLYWVWTFLYLLFPWIKIGNFLRDGFWFALLSYGWGFLGWFIEVSPLRLIFEGTSYHLWFLMSLFCCMLITSLLSKKEIFLWALAGICFLLSIQYATYAPWIAHPSEILQIMQRTFYYFIFFVLGYHWAGRPVPRPFWCPLLLVVGVLAHSTEIFLQVPLYFGNLILSSGIFLFLRHNPALGKNSFLSSNGQLTLGIYAVHVFVLEVLRPWIDLIPVWIGSAVYPGAIYFGALGASVFLQKNPGLRRLVS